MDKQQVISFWSRPWKTGSRGTASPDRNAPTCTTARSIDQYSLARYGAARLWQLFQMTITSPSVRGHGQSGDSKQVQAGSRQST